MHYQHRNGLPGRPRNNDHTRWERDTVTESTGWIGLFVIFMMILVAVVVSL